MNDQDYHSDFDHVSCSMLKVFCDSPVKYYHHFIAQDMKQKPASKYMELGSAVHAVLLEETPIHEAVRVYPETCLKSDGSINGKPAAQFRADYPAEMYVKDDAQFRTLIASIRSSPIGKLIEACRYRETEHRWMDDAGVLCRCKPDAYGIVDGVVKVYDLKITEQIERIITDNLPPYVKTLQCTKCGVMGVCLVEGPKNGDVSV